jgi:hypothetical protein
MKSSIDKTYHIVSVIFVNLLNIAVDQWLAFTSLDLERSRTGLQARNW